MPNVEINTTSKLFLMFFSMDSLKDKSVPHCTFIYLKLNIVECSEQQEYADILDIFFVRLSFNGWSMVIA